jgi:hypothetical protein
MRRVLELRSTGVQIIWLKGKQVHKLFSAESYALVMVLT